MAHLTLRDIASDEQIVVPAAGFTFGRVGGDADIQLDDDTIARRQVRVAVHLGQWVMETMATPTGRRAPPPETLREGQTFFIGQSEFEVLAIEPAAPSHSDAARARATETTPRAQASPAGGRPAASQPRWVDDGLTNQTPLALAWAERLGTAVQAFLEALPRGVLHLFTSTGPVLLHPLRTLRRCAEALPSEPLNGPALVGYALPALFAAVTLEGLAAGVAFLAGGRVAPAPSPFPAGILLVAPVVAIIVGAAFHPAIAWLVRALGGESDEHSRTNFFLQLVTVSVILALPVLVGTLLRLLPWAPLAAAGPLLETLAVALASALTYRWFSERFGVAQWVRRTVLAVGVLAVAGSATAVAQAVLATVRGNSDAVRAEASAETVVEEEGLASDETGGVAEHPLPPAPARLRAFRPRPAALLTKEGMRGAVADEPAAAREPSQERTASAVATFRARLEGAERALQANPRLLRAPEVERLYGAFLDVAYRIDRELDQEITKHPAHEKLLRLRRDDRLATEAGALINELAAQLGVP